MRYQIIGTDENPRNAKQTALTFAQFINQELGLPVFGVQGWYKGESENSYRVNLDVNFETTKHIAQRLARVFGQESILIVDTSTNEGYLQSSHGEPSPIGKKTLLAIGEVAENMTFDGKHNRYTFIKQVEDKENE